MKKTLAQAGNTACEILAETLWPTRCAICDVQGALLCETCAQNLAFIDACRACPRCGAPFGMVQCSECNPVMLKASGRNDVPFRMAASTLTFDDKAKRIVSAYKDQGEQRLAHVMAQLMSRYIAPSWTKGGSALVTHIPATNAAFRRRGFDHAEILAREIASNAHLRHENLFMRPKSIDQRTLSRQGRQANMANKFRTLPGITPPETAIVVDDVCTTGSTLYAACDALASAGAKTLYCLTFARVW